MLKGIRKFFKRFRRRKTSKIMNVTFVVIAVFVVCVFLFVGLRALKSGKRYELVSELPAKLKISTDKVRYNKDELVHINIYNTALNSISQQPGSLVRGKISARRFFGRNYGVGLIEKNIDEIWVAYEPIYRCGNSCFSDCTQEDLEISKSGNSTYAWNQEIFICDPLKRSEERVWADKGVYRITVATLSGTDQEIRFAHSEEFRIK